MIDALSRRKQRRILVVDDYADARGNVRDALEGLGYGVLEAGHGQEALNVLISNAPRSIELILLDLQMPVMDGWQFLRLLKSYVGLRQIPIVVVSAHPPRLEEANHPGVVGVLHSPYDMYQLLALVNACLSH
jgi:CheY-like chemotaxis protein